MVLNKTSHRVTLGVCLFEKIALTIWNNNHFDYINWNFNCSALIFSYFFQFIQKKIAYCFLICFILNVTIYKVWTERVTSHLCTINWKIDLLHSKKKDELEWKQKQSQTIPSGFTHQCIYRQSVHVARTHEKLCEHFFISIFPPKCESKAFYGENKHNFRHLWVLELAI